jgi:flavin reductase (DIM6/NTAB) family NADH-FMN oxidoreductase RutF
MPRFTGGDLDDAGWAALLTAAIVPRPIAWITSRSPDGVVNLAPFSFFTAVTHRPPTLAVAIAHRDPEKDTLRNLRSTGEAVVHLIPPGMAEAANASSAPYPAGVSEAERLGLDLITMAPVAVPRLAVAEIALACRLDRCIPVGEPATTLVLLQVVSVEIAEAVATAGGLPDPRRMRAWARVGGASWLAPEAWHLVDLPRPGRADCNA